MTALPRPAASLAWRLAVTAVVLRLVYSAFIQGYAVYDAPQTSQLQALYATPQFLMPLVAQVVSSALIAGLVVWCTLHRWLIRHNTTAVDLPGKLFGTYIALALLYALGTTAGMGVLQNILLAFIVEHRELVQGWLGEDRVRQLLAMSLSIKLATLALDLIGTAVIVRIATWTVAPSGPPGAPSYGRQNAAWIAGLTVLVWQLNVSLVLGSFLMMHTLSASWTEYALGYWVLPAIVMVLCVLTCLNFLPRPLGQAGVGRAVAHGSIAFWAAQVLGIGLGLLALRAMTWGQLARVSESYTAAAVTLLIYGALLALGCVGGSLALYKAPQRAQTFP